MQRFRINREFVQAGAELLRAAFRQTRVMRLTPASQHRFALPRRPSIPRRLTWPSVPLCLLLALACVPDVARRGQAGHEQAAGGPGRPALDLTAEASWPAAYQTDPAWQRAASGSDFDRARLAQRESAAALLVALSEGGSLGRTALAALPYARDRREVVGRLCALVLGPVAPTSSWLLGALYEAIADGPRTEESVDPEADAHCSDSLRQLSGRADTSPEDRDRALGAISLLAKR